MNTINKLSNSTVHEDAVLAAKINELVDAVNELIRCNNNTSTTYLTPGPSPYDLNAIANLKKSKP